LMLLHTFADPGTCCPLSMTFAAYPVMQQTNLEKYWLKKPLNKKYDPAFIPAAQKSSVMFGMGMTEKQGGSDVRANTTYAKRIDHNHSIYYLTGHKWFCSAPMSDAFLMTAQTEEGIGCFFVPRFTPEGKFNPF